MSSSFELSKNILLCLMAYQRDHRYLTRAGSSELSLQESQCLLLIEGNPDLPIGTYMEWLGESKAHMTRCVKALDKASLIELKKSDKDKRQKLIALSTTGHRFLAQRHKENNAFVAKKMKNLSSRELREFQDSLRLFCDALGAPSQNISRKSLPIRNEIGRLTRVFGLHRRGVFQVSDFSALEWHTLSILSASPGLSLSEIQKELRVPLPTLSITVERLVASGLIEKQHSSRDRRFVSSELTSAGQAELERINQHALDKIETALSTFSSKGAEKFSRSLMKFVELAPDKDGEDRVVELNSPSQRLEARSLVLDKLKQDEVSSSSGYLIAPDSFVFGLFRKGALRGVVELRAQKSGFLIVNFAQSFPKERRFSAKECCRKLLAYAGESLCGDFVFETARAVTESAVIEQALKEIGLSSAHSSLVL